MCRPRSSGPCSATSWCTRSGGPWRKVGYRSEGDAAANDKGAVYWLEGSKRYGFRYPVSVEEILDVEPGIHRPARHPGAQLPGRGHPDPVTRRPFVRPSSRPSAAWSQKSLPRGR
jgi:hypothetical protein